ncbi:MAG: transcriptional regulator, LuxR family, partial [Solirubrobacterales bacterium]|nr:transcriptional regulator, LuxR family [Solirubrobacterales bacterium]
TPAERRVAVLAAQGRTNREIAEALVVTRKTVDWHLGRAYRKLGVNDRSRLEALLAAPPGGAGGPDDRPVGPAPDGPAAPHGPHSPG